MIPRKGRKSETREEVVPLKIYSSRGWLKNLPKPMSPAVLAEKMLRNQGFSNAQRILENNGREMLGQTPHTTVNPHMDYYKTALAHLKAISGKK